MPDLHLQLSQLCKTTTKTTKDSCTGQRADPCGWSQLPHMHIVNLGTDAGPARPACCFLPSENTAGASTICNHATCSNSPICLQHCHVVHLVQELQGVAALQAYWWMRTASILVDVRCKHTGGCALQAYWLICWRRCAQGHKHILCMHQLHEPCKLSCTC